MEPRAVDPRDLEFPWYLPWGSTVGACFIAAEALRHRALEWGTGVLWLAVPMALLAVSPFVIDLVGHRLDRFLLPRLPFAVLTIAPVVVLMVDSPTETDFAPFLLVLVCIQGASTATSAEAGVMMGAACGCLLGLEVAGQFDGTGIWIVGTLAAGGGGVAVRKSLETLALEQSRQAEQMAGAAAEERHRIAREVHDVVAHSLSVTMLHLTGARHALESGGNPGEAAAALRNAERLGRQAMHDIRRTVGLLAPDAVGDTAPMPGAADIPALVREFVSAGLNVECEVRGDPASVPTATGLGLYRIAQESLANVAKHAPAAESRLELALGSSVVSLVIRSALPGAVPGTPGANGGLGLKGMEERARLLGGTFRAGPEDGAWVVAVDVPRANTVPLDLAGG